jgi:hypothetical protein
MDENRTEAYQLCFKAYLDMIIGPMKVFGQKQIQGMCANHIDDPSYARKYFFHYSYTPTLQYSITPTLHYSNGPNSGFPLGPTKSWPSGLGFFTNFSGSFKHTDYGADLHFRSGCGNDFT